MVWSVRKTRERKKDRESLSVKKKATATRSIKMPATCFNNPAIITKKNVRLVTSLIAGVVIIIIVLSEFFSNIILDNEKEKVRKNKRKNI